MQKIKFFVFAALVVLALVSQLSFAQEKEHLIVIVNTLVDEDVTVGNPEYTDALIYQRLSYRYPKALPLFVRSSDGDEIRAQLKAGVRDHHVIDAFILMSHGDYDSQTGHAYVFYGNSFAMYPDLYHDVRDYFSLSLVSFANSKIFSTDVFSLWRYSPSESCAHDEVAQHLAFAQNLLWTRRRNLP